MAALHGARAVANRSPNAETVRLEMVAAERRGLPTGQETAVDATRGSDSVSLLHIILIILVVLLIIWLITSVL
jgi:hypothetical protein